MEKLRFYFLWLSLICIIIFIFQLIIPGFTDYFVLNTQAIYNFQIWRFLTAIFLHQDFIHLLYNLFALMLFGFILEKKIGSRNFLIVFLSSGILANIIAVNFYESSLGASGAIYGILGCLTMLSPMMMIWVFGILMPMFIAAIIWIIAGILGLFIPSNTGHIAHLSGIAMGFLAGILLYRYRDRKQRKNGINLPDNYIRNWEDRYIR